MGTGAPFLVANRALLVRVGTAVLVAVTAVYAVLIGSELVQQAQNWSVLHRDRDFPSYYLAAQRLLRGEDFYAGLQMEAQALGIPNYFIDAAVTPPTFAVVTIPLAFFPYPVAWGIWQLLSLVALAFSVFLMVREEGWPRSLAGRIRLGCLFLLFPPLTFHLLYAHTELFMLILFTGSWLYLRRGRQVAGGILLGLAGAIRIYPLLLLLYLLQRRAWKALAAALGSGLGLAVLAALVAGPSSYLRYLGTLRETGPTLYPLWGNASLWGDVFKIAAVWPALGQQPILRDGLAAALSLGILALTLWRTRKQEPALSSLDRDYGLFIVAALLASPLSWIYYQVLLYLPALFLLAVRPEERRPPIVPWILTTTWALALLAPLLGGQPGLPAGLQNVLSFLPTLTLAGVYLALALPARMGLTKGDDSIIIRMDTERH